MTPLGGVAIGLGLAIGDLDLRVSSLELDLLPDPVGWLLVVVALSRLRDAGFRRARGMAVAAGSLSLLDLLAGASSDGGGLDGALGTVHDVVLTLALVLIALAVRARARVHGEPEEAARFLLLAVLLGALGAVALLVSSAASAVEAPALLPLAAVLLMLGLADLAVAVWLVVALALRRRLPWLQADVADAVEVPSGGRG